MSKTTSTRSLSSRTRKPDMPPDSPDPLLNTGDPGGNSLKKPSITIRPRSNSLSTVSKTPETVKIMPASKEKSVTFIDEVSMEDYVNLKKEVVEMRKEITKLTAMLGELIFNKPLFSEISKKISFDGNSNSGVEKGKKDLAFFQNAEKMKMAQKTSKGASMHPKENKPKESDSGEILRVKVKAITSSKWVGMKFMYFVEFDDPEWNSRWLEPSEFAAESVVSEFHELHPGSAKPDDYEDIADWKIVQRKQRHINKKLEAKKNLSQADIEFVAKGLTAPIDKPREFKRLHLKITNKQVIRRCSYKQRIKIVNEILHSYGLSGCVIRTSFIGVSILEVYIQAESEDKFRSGMIQKGWSFDDNFDFYAIPSFIENPVEMLDTAHKALVQRLAFLIANTHLVNLHKCIKDNLKENTIIEIETRVNEIQESRKGERTAYVAKSL